MMVMILMTITTVGIITTSSNINNSSITHQTSSDPPQLQPTRSCLYDTQQQHASWQQSLAISRQKLCQRVPGNVT